MKSLDSSNFLRFSANKNPYIRRSLPKSKSETSRLAGKKPTLSDAKAGDSMWFSNARQLLQLLVIVFFTFVAFAAADAAWMPWVSRQS